MDAASGAAVAALGVKETDRVLDLCCSPGMKLSAFLAYLGPGGVLHGVDNDRGEKHKLTSTSRHPNNQPPKAR